MIQIVLRAGPDGTAIEKTEVEDLSEVIAQDKAIVWVDVVNPTSDELKLIGEELKLHPLTLEDILQGERPISLFSFYRA